MKKLKDKNFSVTARLVLIVEIPVVASSFEEAIISANKLTEHDFVTIDGSYNDGSIKIVSVGIPKAWATDDSQ